MTARKKSKLHDHPVIQVDRSDLRAKRAGLESAIKLGRGVKAARARLERSEKQFLRSVNKLMGRKEGKV